MAWVHVLRSTPESRRSRTARWLVSAGWVRVSSTGQRIGVIARIRNRSFIVARNP